MQLFSATTNQRQEANKNRLAANQPISKQKSKLMMWSAFIVGLLVLQLLPSSFSFLISRESGFDRTRLLFSSLVRPVFVDSQVSLHGVTMALYAFLDLTGKLKIPQDAEESSPDELPVYAITDVEKLEQSTSAILHVSVGPNNSEQLSPKVVQKISYIGVYLAAEVQGEDRIQVSPEAAQGSVKVLQHQLGLLSSPPGSTTTVSESPKACVTLDVALHAAILKTNSLPRPKSTWTSPIASATPHQDAYYVMQENGDTILVEYLFDQTNVAGMDPLFCETRETLVETSPTKPSLLRSIVQSAAYTALRGNDMDSMGSAAIAASVATILGDSNFVATGQTVLWSDVQRVVKLAQHIRQHGTKTDMAGMMRQKYLALGYQ